MNVLSEELKWWSSVYVRLFGAPSPMKIGAQAYEVEAAKLKIARHLLLNPSAITPDIIDGTPGKEEAPVKITFRPVFDDFDHRLSVVKRWAIAHTIQTQSVAEHIFNVERMAIRIAMRWCGITSRHTLLAVMLTAHHHEDFEALSGDLPTMVKPYFNEFAFENEHQDVMQPLPEGFKAPLNESNTVRLIVKTADLLEGHRFLCMERALGNRYMERHFEHESERIKQWAADNWDADPNIVSLIIHEVDRMPDTCFSSRVSMRGR